MKSKGLGDTIEKITKSAGWWRPNCKKCEKRKKALNKLVPYGKAKEKSGNERNS